MWDEEGRDSDRTTVSGTTALPARVWTETAADSGSGDRSSLPKRRAISLPIRAGNGSAGTDSGRAAAASGRDADRGLDPVDHRDGGRRLRTERLAGRGRHRGRDHQSCRRFVDRPDTAGSRGGRPRTRPTSRRRRVVPGDHRPALPDRARGRRTRGDVDVADALDRRRRRSNGAQRLEPRRQAPAAEQPDLGADGATVGTRSGGSADESGCQIRLRGGGDPTGGGGAAHDGQRPGFSTRLLLRWSPGR